MSLFTVAEEEGMLESTGGVLLRHAAEETWAQFDEFPIEALPGEGVGVLTTVPSVIIAAGTFAIVDHDTGVGERVTTIDASERYPGAVEWTVRRVEQADQDGGTIRLMLAEPHPTD